MKSLPIRSLVLVLVALAVLAASGLAASRPLTLGLKGAGPLRLGMTEAAALKTGWLAHKTTGCALGGPPVPVDYAVSGPKAPKGVSGTAEFDKGKLTVLSFSKGVRSSLGISVGRTSVSRMVARYRKAGFKASASYDHTFGGTFVTVERGGQQLLGAFATHSGRIDTLAIPNVPVCD